MRPLPRRVRRIAAATGTLAAAALIGVIPTAGAASATAAHTPSAHPLVAPVPKKAIHRFATPPTAAECATIGLSCYTPQQLQKAYDMGPLYQHGFTGKGKKVLIVDSYGSPTIQHDLDVFSDTFHLPRTHVQIIQPSGRVPAFDPNNADQAGWATETTLDVEQVHTMAPGAQIVLAETPVSETEGLQGLPEMMHAEQWAMNHHLADVISQSFGAGEATFAHPRSDIASVRFAFQQALRQHVTVLASSGDTGAADYDVTGTKVLPFRQASWPASDPLVTSVGGTAVHLDANGNRTQPDQVWNESSIFQDSVAGGGGTSGVFERPWYQNGVARVVRDDRGYPDISMNAAVYESPILYWSIPGQGTGFILGVGGTSAAAPLFAGFVAVADQLAHRDLGLLNPALYALHDKPWSGEVDVTVGNNDTPAVKGFAATRGYDLASGWGTIDGAKLAWSLARHR
ncbi:MAG: S53 family peptidase [Curtobacterium sp.]